MGKNNKNSKELKSIYEHIVVVTAILHFVNDKGDVDLVVSVISY